MGMSLRKTSYLLSRTLKIKPTPTTMKNPQANSILERAHQVLGDMLRTKILQKYDFDDMDHWSEVLASVYHRLFINYWRNISACYFLKIQKHSYY